MSGVRVGGRLEQLIRLRTQVDVEIEAERRRLDTEPPPRTRPEVSAAVRAAQERVDARLAALGATTRDVRAWAVDQGLIPTGTRGRVATSLVDAYETAHQEQQT